MTAPQGIALDVDNAGEIARIGEMLHAAAAEQLEAVHPENPAVADRFEVFLGSKYHGKLLI